MDVIEGIFDYITEPGGMGFPILIGVGLGIILYLMHFTTKEEKKAQDSIDKKKDYDKYNNRNIPYKPF